MTAACCVPAWHDGAKVPAPWRVRGVVRTSDRFAVDAVYETRQSTWGDSGLFVCCDHHLAQVIVIMEGRHHAVVVTRETRP